MQELLKEIDGLHARLSSHKPFEGHLSLLVKDYFRIEQTYTSTALEGFSYTEEETKVLLEDGLTAGGKTLRDVYAIVGHAKAYDYMYELIGKKSILENDILKFHSMLAGALDSNDASLGRYRTVEVFISGSKYEFMKAKEVPNAMKKFFEQYLGKKATLHPVEFAAFIHKEIATIHPFEDGNGRVARLAMNTALIQEGYLPAIIPPTKREEYASVLDKTHFGSDSEYYTFMANCEYETLQSMIRLIESSTHKTTTESFK